MIARGASHDANPLTLNILAAQDRGVAERISCARSGEVLALRTVMECKRSLPFRILDAHGQPLPTRLEDALASLAPKLVRQFPRLRDDPSIVDLLEEAGRKIQQREEQRGPVERLHAYAWVTVRSLALSRLRHGSERLARCTLPSREGQIALQSAAATEGSPEALERRLLLRQVLNSLSAEERLICAWKRAGYSSREIAARRGTTAAAVDKMLSRARERVRGQLSLKSGDVLQAGETIRPARCRRTG